MRRLAWLTARPIAHRGLHDGVAVIENTPSAVQAAVEAGYGVEVDLQVTADGEAMVHHDEALGRLTEGAARLAETSAAALRKVPFRQTADRMMTLGELLDLVGGRTSLLLEMKTRWDGDERLVDRVAAVLRTASMRSASVAVMSFDPLHTARMAERLPDVVRGIVAESWHRGGHGDAPSAGERGRLRYLQSAIRTRPHFIAYHVRDLPGVAPAIARQVFGLPLLAWTVRTPDDRERAARWADQIIFEGFRP
jgi:glycerophosphoryl diester phosphodiesterase